MKLGLSNMLHLYRTGLDSGLLVTEGGAWVRNSKAHTWTERERLQQMKAQSRHKGLFCVSTGTEREGLWREYYMWPYLRKGPISGQCKRVGTGENGQNRHFTRSRLIASSGPMVHPYLLAKWNLYYFPASQTSGPNSFTPRLSCSCPDGLYRKWNTDCIRKRIRRYRGRAIKCIHCTSKTEAASAL